MSLAAVFAHSRTARHVVGRVAHESEQVDNLFCMFDAVFFAHLGCAQFLHARCAMSRPAHEHARTHQLRIVLVGCHHVHLDSLFGRFQCQRTDDVVGLEARHFKYGNAVCSDDVLNHGHCPPYVLGRGLALSLVFGVSLVAESAPLRVEGNADEIGLFGANHVVERIDKSVGRRSVLPLRIDAGRTEQGIVSAVNQRVGVEQIEGLHKTSMILGNERPLRSAAHFAQSGPKKQAMLQRIAI